MPDRCLMECLANLCMSAGQENSILHRETVSEIPHLFMAASGKGKVVHLRPVCRKFVLKEVSEDEASGHDICKFCQRASGGTKEEKEERIVVSQAKGIDASTAEFSTPSSLVSESNPANGTGTIKLYYAHHS